MKANNVIRVFEHQSLRLKPQGELNKHHFDALLRFNSKNKNKFYTVGHNKITFNQYVGVIQVKGLTIEVLPKADNDLSNNYDKWSNALITMLKECKLIKLESLTNAYLKTKSSSLIDIYFDSFLTEVEKLLRQGLSKKYRRVGDNIDTLKGKLSFNNHIKRNYIHKEKFYCEYQSYDKNHLLNQILLKAVHILSQLTLNPDLLSRAKSVLFDFDDIKVVEISEKDFKNLILDRNTERYKYALTLAKLIILNYSPDLKAGEEDVLAILFDMNKLYENFIYRKLKKVMRMYPNINIKEQFRKKFWQTRGIKPDIYIEDLSKKKKIVIDTKWKVLTELKPSDEDLKQMFVYNHYYDTCLSILLYPKVSVDSDLKKPYHPYNDEDNDLYCQMCFVDLFDESQKQIKRNLGEHIYKELLEQELSEL